MKRRAFLTVGVGFAVAGCSSSGDPEVKSDENELEPVRYSQDQRSEILPDEAGDNWDSDLQRRDQYHPGWARVWITEETGTNEILMMDVGISETIDDAKQRFDETTTAEKAWDRTIADEAVYFYDDVDFEDGTASKYYFRRGNAIGKVFLAFKDDGELIQNNEADWYAHTWYDEWPPGKPVETDGT